MALDTSESVTVNVFDRGLMTASEPFCLATIPALIAMKSVAITRRADSNHPHKAGSDIHDLYRLVNSDDFESITSSIAEHDAHLCRWVGDELIKLFSPEQDLRYTYMRLQRYHSDAAAITEDDLAVVAELGHLMSLEN